MPKFVLGLSFLIVGGGGLWFALPWLTETKLLRDCAEPEPDETCVTRMRAMGHVWSRKGNMEKAKFWYGQSAERGDPSAMFHLAWIYEQAAQKDFEAKLRQLAQRFTADPTDAPQPSKIVRRPVETTNIGIAKTWYRKSADLGFAPAMNNLGQIYLHGTGGLQDHGRAFELHMAAAEAGNPVACWNVAIAYRAGHGVDPDPNEATKWEKWTPAAGIAPDLAEPTLSRTVLYGSTVPESYRADIQASAKLGTPVVMHQKPMKVDPSLPTFREVADKLPNQSTSWNRRAMKADPRKPAIGKPTRELQDERRSSNKRPTQVNRPLPDLR